MNLPDPTHFTFHSLQELQQVTDQIQKEMLASLEKVKTTQEAESLKTLFLGEERAHHPSDDPLKERL